MCALCICQGSKFSFYTVLTRIGPVPLPQVYKTICERKALSKELAEFERGPATGCIHCNKSVNSFPPRYFTISGIIGFSSPRVNKLPSCGLR